MVGSLGQRVGVEAPGDRTQVEPGAAGEDRDAAALGEVAQDRPGMADEVGDA